MLEPCLVSIITSAWARKQAVGFWRVVRYDCYLAARRQL